VYIDVNIIISGIGSSRSITITTSRNSITIIITSGIKNIKNGSLSNNVALNLISISISVISIIFSSSVSITIGRNNDKYINDATIASIGIRTYPDPVSIIILLVVVAVVVVVVTEIFINYYC
jgi:hypothetical protein